MKLARRRLVSEAEIAGLADAARRVLGSCPSVVAAYLHGSAARGEPAADLDVAVLLDAGGPVGRELERLARELQAEGAPGGPELDVRSLASASPRFCAGVISEGRVLFERERAQRVAFEARAMSEWLDFKPTWERMRRLMIDRWTHG